MTNNDNQPDENPLLIDGDKAAELLSISRVTLRRLVRRGEIPQRRIGHAVRFRYEDLRAFAEQTIKA